MGASTMSDDPIRAGEFNRALDSLREAQDRSHKSLSEAIKTGFSAVEQSITGIRADIQGFRSFQNEQAEKNGRFEEKHQRQRDDLSKSNRIITEEMDSVKSKQDKQQGMLMGALISLVLFLVGLVVDIFLRFKGAK